MLKAVDSLLNTNLDFLRNSRCLLAISGGVDSVVLAHICHLMNLDIALAHCNFSLRGKESDDDETFISELAKDLDVELFTQRFDTQAYAKLQKVSIQMAARELRYEWFNELATQLNYDYVLTAHHADDNLETFLINFLRGTGINGLTGIPKIQGVFIRPLLDFSRENIMAFAKDNNITWRDDSSNNSRKYLRNKLRYDVVPILKEINPEVLETMQRTLSNLQDAVDIVTESVNAVRKRALVKNEDNEKHFLISEFKKLNNPKAYLFEFFKDYGFSEWDDVLHLLDAQSGKYVLSSTHRLIKHREVLILSERKKNIISGSHPEPVEGESATSLLVFKNQEEFILPQGKLNFKEVNELSDHSDNRVFVDKSRLNFPLSVRHWEQGDVFCPFGMQGKKKLSKFFKDEKYSLLDKEKQLVLCSHNEIVWVIGKRLDNRFKVTHTTETILKIELM